MEFNSSRRELGQWGRTPRPLDSNSPQWQREWQIYLQRREELMNQIWERTQARDIWARTGPLTEDPEVNEEILDDVEAGVLAGKTQGPPTVGNPDPYQMGQNEWNDLVGFANFHDIENPDQYRSDPATLIQLIEEARMKYDRPEMGEPVSQLDIWSVAGRTLYAGAIGEIANVSQRIPFMGDWLSRMEWVQDSDQWLNEVAEGARMDVPEELDLGWRVSHSLSGMVGYLFPGAAAWRLAGAVGAGASMVGLGARLSPIARGAIQGGATAWMLEGGGDAPVAQRAMLVGLGAAGGAAFQHSNRAAAAALLGPIGGAIGYGITEEPEGAIAGFAAGVALPFLAGRAQRAFRSRYSPYDYDGDVGDRILDVPYHLVEEPSTVARTRPDIPEAEWGFVDEPGPPTGPAGPPQAPTGSAPPTSGSSGPQARSPRQMGIGSERQIGSPAQNRIQALESQLHAMTEQRNLARRAAEEHPLTGLPNRRAFELARPEADLDEAWEWVVMDGRRFKAVNDELGHNTGDAVLQNFAVTLRSVADQMEIPQRIFHFGGDEFAALVPSGHGLQFRRLVQSQSVTHPEHLGHTRAIMVLDEPGATTGEIITATEAVPDPIDIWVNRQQGRGVPSEQIDIAIDRGEIVDGYVTPEGFVPIDMGTLTTELDAAVGPTFEVADMRLLSHKDGNRIDYSDTPDAFAREPQALPAASAPPGGVEASGTPTLFDFPSLSTRRTMMPDFPELGEVKTSIPASASLTMFGPGGMTPFEIEVAGLTDPNFPAGSRMLAFYFPENGHLEINIPTLAERGSLGTRIIRELGRVVLEQVESLGYPVQTIGGYRISGANPRHTFRVSAERFRGKKAASRGVAQEEAVAISKQQQILEAPNLDELAQRAEWDDYDVIVAAEAANPDQTILVRDVLMPVLRERVLEVESGLRPYRDRRPPTDIDDYIAQAELESSEALTARRRDEGIFEFALTSADIRPVGDPEGRVDVLVRRGGVPDWQVEQYEQHGFFVDQRAKVGGQEVVIRSIGNERSSVQPVHGGRFTSVRNSEIVPLNSGYEKQLPEGVLEDFIEWSVTRINEEGRQAGLVNVTRVSGAGLAYDPVFRDMWNEFALDLASLDYTAEDVLSPEGILATQLEYEALTGRKLSQREVHNALEHLVEGEAEGIRRFDWTGPEMSSQLPRYVQEYFGERNIPAEMQPVFAEQLLERRMEDMRQALAPLEWAEARRAIEQNATLLEAADEAGMLVPLTTEELALSQGYRYIPYYNGPSQTPQDFSTGGWFREGEGRINWYNTMEPDVWEWVPSEMIFVNSETTQRVAVPDLEAAQRFIMGPEKQAPRAGIVRDLHSSWEMPVESEEAAREFLRTVNRQLPGIEPITEIPVEVMETIPGGAIPTEGPSIPFVDDEHMVTAMEGQLESMKQDIENMNKNNVRRAESSKEPPDEPPEGSGGGGGAAPPPPPPPTGPPPPPPPSGGEGSSRGAWTRATRAVSEEEAARRKLLNELLIPDTEVTSLVPAGGGGSGGNIGRGFDQLRRSDPRRFNELMQMMDSIRMRWLEPMRNWALQNQQRLQEYGITNELWRQYADVSNSVTVAHNEMGPHLQVWADIVGDFRHQLRRDGTVVRIEQIPNWNDKLRAMQEAEYTPKEMAAQARIRPFFDMLWGLAREGGRIGYIFDYLPALRRWQEMDDPNVDPYKRWLDDLPHEWKWFARYPRAYGVQATHADIGSLGSIYIRGLFFEKHVAPHWNQMQADWSDPRIPDVLQATVKGWLDLVLTGQGAQNETAVTGVRHMLNSIGVPVTDSEVRSMWGGLFGTMYRAGLGFSPYHIFRDAIQPLFTGTEIGFKWIAKAYNDWLFGSAETKQAMYRFALENGWVERGQTQVALSDVFTQPAEMHGGVQALSPQLQARRENLAQVMDIIYDITPKGLKQGVQGTGFDPLLGYTKLGEFNRMMAGWAGYQKAVAASQEFMEGKYGLHRLIRKSGASFYPKPIQDDFRKLVESGKIEEANILLAQEAANSQFRYGTKEQAVRIQQAGVKGKVGMMYGTFSFQYLARMRDALSGHQGMRGYGGVRGIASAVGGGLVGGPPGAMAGWMLGGGGPVRPEAMAFLARQSALWAFITGAVAVTGWKGLERWKWHRSLTFGGGPLLTSSIETAQAGTGVVRTMLGERPDPAQRSAMAQFGIRGLDIVNPLRGGINTMQGIAEGLGSPWPVEETAEFILTGNRGTGLRFRNFFDQLPGASGQSTSPQEETQARSMASDQDINSLIESRGDINTPAGNTVFDTQNPPWHNPDEPSHIQELRRLIYSIETAREMGLDKDYPEMVIENGVRTFQPGDRTEFRARTQQALDRAYQYINKWEASRNNPGGGFFQ